MCSQEKHDDDCDAEGIKMPTDFKRSVYNSEEGGMSIITDNTDDKKRSKSQSQSPLSSLFQSKIEKQTNQSIYNLKSILINDDKALLSEANELRRLTDPSTWIDEKNTKVPNVSKVNKDSFITNIYYNICMFGSLL